MTDTGILSYAGYIPLRRLSRAAIAHANGWANASLKSMGRGERAMANWDEDAVTMAVEASRDCLRSAGSGNPDALLFASTTRPFADRNNAGLIAGALDLPEELRTLDSAASLRAGTSALIQALRDSHSSRNLVVAADKRKAKPGSPQEMLYGDGAAAILVGRGEPVAELLGARSLTRDLVDHYRSADAAFDYTLEERWVRDEGYMKMVPEVVNALLAETGTDATSIHSFILPGAARTTSALAAAIGIPGDAVADNLHENCGDTGCAHPLLMLSDALETAEPGQRLLLVGFGQGVDALLLRTTDSIARLPAGHGIRTSLARRHQEENYMRYLSFAGLVEMDWGMRAERDNRTAQSTFYRKRRDITAFVGGRCRACGTAQFPRSPVCVDCGAIDSQEDHRFADSIGTIRTFTEDYLGYSPSPPLQYGQIAFEQGGSLMMEFTDFPPGSLGVGMDVRMVFRIKDIDDRRGFRRYFWKPAPVSS